MSDRPGEREAFLGFSSPDQRNINCSTPPLGEQVFHRRRGPSPNPVSGGSLSESVNIDRGQFVGRRLNHVAIVMHLDQFAPVGRWAASGRKRGRLERLAKMCENLTDGLWIGDEGDEPNITAAVRALEWKLLATAEPRLKPQNWIEQAYRSGDLHCPRLPC